MFDLFVYAVCFSPGSSRCVYSHQLISGQTSLVEFCGFMCRAEKSRGI